VQEAANPDKLVKHCENCNVAGNSCKLEQFKNISLHYSNTIGNFISGDNKLKE
jgi:hypothetical protein